MAKETEIKEVQEEVKANETEPEKPGKIARAKAWVGNHKLGILTGAAAAAAGAVALGVKAKFGGKISDLPPVLGEESEEFGGGAEI